MSDTNNSLLLFKEINCEMFDCTNKATETIEVEKKLNGRILSDKLFLCRKCKYDW